MTIAHDFRTLLRAILAGRDLDAEQMAFAVGAMMDASWSPVQTGAFLAALATKGETAAEVFGAAEAMRARSLHVEHDLPLVVEAARFADGKGAVGVHGGECCSLFRHGSLHF